MPPAMAAAQGVDVQIRLQDRVAQTLAQRRHEHGALDLEVLEPRAVMSDGEVVDLRQQQRNRATQLIEDFMIAANGVTARYLQAKGFPTLRRVVRSPERWDKLRSFAAGFGDALPGTPDAKALADFLAANLQADAGEKQKMLEELDVEKRLRMVAVHLANQLDRLELQNRIQSQVRENIDKSPPIAAFPISSRSGSSRRP